MKRLTLVLFALVALTDAFGAGMKSAFRFDVTDVYLERQVGDSLLCRVNFEILDDAVANRSAVVLQPYVLIDGLKRMIQPVSFYRLDNKGRRAQVRSNGFPASGQEDEMEKVCGLSKGPLALSGIVDGKGVKDSIEVYVDVFEVRATDKINLVESRRIALFYPTPRPEFKPEYLIKYVDDKEKYRFDRHVTSTLCVEFEEGKNVFKPDLGLNPGVLYEFEQSVTPVVTSPHTRVQEITLTAYSGIAGSVAANQTKMQVRLNSVYSYLKKKGVFGRKAVSLKVAGEDWATLQAWFSTTSWHYDRSLNDIIFGPASKDSKERNLRDCVTFWNYMEDNLFPELERFECTIRFAMIDYADDTERWAAYNADKRLLSQYDYSCLLKTFPVWSQSWYELVFDFAEVYPLCREAQMDALAAVLSLGRLNQATDYMKVLSGPEALFYRAVWLMMQDRIEEAYETVLALDLNDNDIYRALYTKISEIYRWSVSPTPWTAQVIRQNG